MPRADGIDQGIEVTISTDVSLGESIARIVDAVRCIFPEFSTSTNLSPSSFPCSNQKISLQSEGMSLANFLGLAAQQRVLDTALDSMSEHLIDDVSIFSISRQAAMVEKISFCRKGESVLGGIITITLKGLQLAEWIEEATWHPGRDAVPRNVRDELSMGEDGEPITWID